MAHLPPPLDPSQHSWLALAELQQHLLNDYPGIALALDPQGRILWANATAAARLGHAPEALADRPRAGEWASACELTPHHANGTPLPVTLALTALRDPQGQATGLLALERLPLADGSLPPLVHHDTLTGLPGRSLLTDRAEMAIQRAARQKSVVALMLVEVDGFAALCEAQGQSVGDDVLRATASRLHFELRKTDTAVRLDGGQFAAMLVDLHQPDEARRVADKILVAVSAAVNTGVARVPVTARIGLAWFPAHGDQLLPLLQAAEAALAQLPAGTGGVAAAALPA